ncbi:hypothetical protein BDY24DRAFT_397902 [Mrakia frigida]|uniref:uncharacterized protein n=1 Tax=Mrakia frigida TaxID=29902 RepID=UPI003FCBFD36
MSSPLLSAPSAVSPSPAPASETAPIAPSTFTSSSLFPHASLPFLLSLLHQPSILASLDPTLVTSIPSPEDPLTYLVTDTQVLLFGLFRGTITYRAIFQEEQDGMEVTVEGPYGVTTRMRWRVNEVVDRDGCEVSLEAESVPAWWTLGFIGVKVEEESKKELVEKFRKRVEEEEFKKSGEQV